MHPSQLSIYSARMLGVYRQEKFKFDRFRQEQERLKAKQSNG